MFFEFGTKVVDPKLGFILVKHPDRVYKRETKGSEIVGKYTEDKKDELITNAKNIGLEAFNTFTESILVKTVNVLNQLNNDGTKNDEKKSKEQKLGEEWQDLITNNKAEALRISREEPKRYEEFVDAFNKIK